MMPSKAAPLLRLWGVASLLLALIAFCFMFTVSDALYVGGKYADLVETGNYTCDEMVRWLGTEKHYSNNKKEILFGLMAATNCEPRSVMQLQHVSFGWSPVSNKRTFFFNTAPNAKQCTAHDDFAVAYLSNFSINNNFSHFLHGLLRLFCALVDARLIQYDPASDRFHQTRNFTIWLDEYFKLNPAKETWLRSFGGQLRPLAREPSKGNCVSSTQLLYGSGCMRLLPPEKWFGYPGCRAGQMLPAFGQYMRQRYLAPGPQELLLLDEPVSREHTRTDPGLRVAFAVRDVGEKTGMRQVSNLHKVQSLIRRTQHIRSSMENVTFEHLDVPSTIRYMAGVHIFVSVHGAGMTNMFFMNPGAAVVEIIPYPLCNCRSPDYFYGIGGYYHGSAVAMGLKHYHYCVPAHEMNWHTKPADAKPGAKCSWRHLHAVESIYIDPTRFVSLMRNVERDLVASGTIVLTQPIINVSPHANG